MGASPRHAPLHHTHASMPSKSIDCGICELPNHRGFEKVFTGLARASIGAGGKRILVSSPSCLQLSGQGCAHLIAIKQQQAF